MGSIITLSIVQSALELGFIYALVGTGIIYVLQYLTLQIFRPMDVLPWDVPSVRP